MEQLNFNMYSTETDFADEVTPFTTCNEETNERERGRERVREGETERERDGERETERERDGERERERGG